VLIHGGAGNVGAFAVQLARGAGLRVVATAATEDIPFVRELGVDSAIDFQTQRFEDVDGAADTHFSGDGRAFGCASGSMNL
jgi:NADPH:quinone reductase-like Zn-dependent oxidoreductase